MNLNCRTFLIFVINVQGEKCDSNIISRYCTSVDNLLFTVDSLICVFVINYKNIERFMIDTGYLVVKTSLVGTLLPT